MSKFYTGKDAILTIDGTDQVKVTNWSLQAELDMLETTTLGDTDRFYTPGIRSYSGSATLLYYEDAGGRNDAAIQIKQVITTGAPSIFPIPFIFNLGGKTITINCYITSASYGATVGEVVSAQISFRGNGIAAGVNI